MEHEPLRGLDARGRRDLAVDAKAALSLGTMGADPGMQSPATAFSADDFPGFRVRIKRTGGHGDAAMYFATTDDPTLGEDKVIRFSVPDDDAFHAVDVDASKTRK